MTDSIKQLSQALARLEGAVRELNKNTESLKGELRTISPRIDTLIAEVREASRLVHRHGNAAQGVALAMSEVAVALGVLEQRVRQIRDVTADEAHAATMVPPKDEITKPEKGDSHG